MATFNLNGIEFERVPAAQSRLRDLADWLADCVQDRPLTVRVASADASFRSYYRATTSTGTFIVMDAPPPAEDTGPFYHLAVRLRAAGVNVPEVFGWDESRGFMLLEDFGNTTLLHRLGDRLDDDELSPADVNDYEQCLHQLVDLQRRADAREQPRYDGPFLRMEMELFRRWLVHRHLNLSWSKQDERHWNQTMTSLVKDAQAQPSVFVHRDYHSRNLMVVDQAADEKQRIGIIDFQDAMCGPLLYDVVSLLKDCYVRLSTRDRDHLLEKYQRLAREAGLLASDDDTLRRQFNAMGMQRHLKAAGIFARLWHRDGKAGYLPDIPRTLSYLVDAGKNDPRYHWCAQWVEQRVLPRVVSDSSHS